MAIETKCPSCDRILRVGDEHAGKQARCPMCNTIYVVPGGTAPDRPAETPNEPWYMKTPEGQIYGPVSHAELEGWLAEGRISSECELRTRENQEWRPADEYFGVLSSRPQARPQPHPQAPVQPHPGTQNPFAENAIPAGHTQGSRYPQDNLGTMGHARSATQRYRVPHRGGMILVFGILGWIFTCPIFSVMAWMMGSSDLREMRTGRMDSSGRGLTQAGHILGMIYTLLWLIVCVIGLFVMLLAMGAQAF